VFCHATCDIYVSPLPPALCLSSVQVGVAAAKLSSFQTDAALAESIQFEEPMHECCRILLEIKAAIKRRGDKRQNLLNGTADLHAKQAAYQKVLGVAGKEDLATAKLVLVETAQERVETAQSELNTTTAQLLVEVAAFKVDKAAEFKSSCREFVKVLVSGRAVQKCPGLVRIVLLTVLRVMPCHAMPCHAMLDTHCLLCNYPTLYCAAAVATSCRSS
jgi:hypothetical protein